MVTTFEQAISKVLAHEGGYVNDPTDRGGETNYGITIAVARENGYSGSMKDMPIEVAKDIYKHKYWDKVRAEELPESIRYIVFDTAINMGVTRAVKLLQQCGEVDDDGIFGTKTMLGASQVELYQYALQRMYFYCQIVRNNQTQAKFIGGWSNRVMDIVKIAKS